MSLLWLAVPLGVAAVAIAIMSARRRRNRVVAPGELGDLLWGQDRGAIEGDQPHSRGVDARGASRIHRD